MEEARKALHNHMRAKLICGDNVFPQDDETRTRNNALLEPIVEEEKLHLYFKRLIEEDGYRPSPFLSGR